MTSQSPRTGSTATEPRSLQIEGALRQVLDAFARYHTSSVIGDGSYDAVIAATANAHAVLAASPSVTEPETPAAPRREVRAELWYPRVDGPQTVDTIRVVLMDVRAANDLVIRYDFDRDGYSISQPTIHEWREGDDLNGEGVVEVAFVPAWIEAEAAALAARPAEAQAGAGIDVERLALALGKFDQQWPIGQKHKAHIHEVDELAFAEQIAAEYASLPTEPTALTCGCRHWIRHIAADPWGETPEREVCPECHHDYHPDGPCAVASLPTEPEAER